MKVHKPPTGQSTGMAALSQHWCYPEVAAKSVQEQNTPEQSVTTYTTLKNLTSERKLTYKNNTAWHTSV